MSDPVSIAEIENDLSQERATKVFEYTKKQQQQEVVELAQQLIDGYPIRVKKYWGQSLLTLDDVIDDVVSGNTADQLNPLIKDFLKGNVEPLHDIYRRTAQYMIARGLFGDAESLGFYIWKEENA